MLAFPSALDQARFSLAPLDGILPINGAYSDDALPTEPADRGRV